MKPMKQFWKNFIHHLKNTKLLGTTLDNILLKLSFGMVLAITIMWMLPTERPFEYSNLTVGSIADEEIIAPFTFPIIKTKEELEQERNEKLQSVPPVFDKNTEIISTQKIKLNAFFKDIDEFFKTQTTQAKKNVNLKAENSEVDSFIQKTYLRYNLKLTDDLLLQFDKLYTDKTLDSFKDILTRGLLEVYSQGILDRAESEISENKIAILQNGVEDVVGLDQVYDIGKAAEHVYTILQKSYSSDRPELKITNYLLTVFLYPNLVYNESLTQERKDKAIHDIAQTRGFVYENQRIIDAHEIVTEDIYRKLQSMAYALKERSSNIGGWEQFKFNIGKALFAISILFIMILYIYFLRKPIFNNNLILGMMTLIFLLQFACAFMVLDFLHWSQYTIPIILAPMLLAMLLDSGVALVSTVTISLVLGAIQSNDYSFSFLSLIVGSISLFSVQKIRNRGQMFRAILYVIVAYLVVNVTFGFFHFEPMKEIFMNFAYYMLPLAVLTPTIVFLLIGIFEKVFDVSTDITLLELSDLNHPLLKRLSVEAPGTFHHTIIVGNLAEAASKAIGANSLLARVGCYYHDVGKILKPEYFVENQMDAMNKHEKLTPTMSCIILNNHVKKGMELAEKYNIPKVVKQFIPEHHGTSLMTFFYNKALKTMDPKDINEDDFRYPGPKPQSKETAIAMLADTVEAASRTLQKPTQPRIRGFVESLIDKKMEENQLDESNLTIKEIDQIKEAFIPILLGIHHVRVEYPSEGDNVEQKAVKQNVETDPTTNGKKKQDLVTKENNNVADQQQKADDPNVGHSSQ
jgi:putative nucleotidyltransferase with HDIG domain